MNRFLLASGWDQKIVVFHQKAPPSGEGGAISYYYSP
jgi:hypothetical protein